MCFTMMFSIPYCAYAGDCCKSSCVNCMTCDVTGAHEWKGVRESKWPNCKYAACGWLFAVHARNLGYCYVKFLPEPSEFSRKRQRMVMSTNIHYARDMFFLQMPGQSPCWSCTDSNACQESITTVLSPPATCLEPQCIKHISI